jgi:RNA polymerase sigma-70 factor (ECF subfamily)
VELLADSALLASMARGDERAAAMLYDRHSAVVYGLALRILGEPMDAEEVALEAFTQLWRTSSAFDASRGSVMGWLTTITRTRALDAVRARKRRERLSSSSVGYDVIATSLGSSPRGADVALDEKERATSVASALGLLPEPQRRVIELAFFEGLTHLEVAERLREPLGTVKTRIRLGMNKLRDVLPSMAPEGVR